MTPTDLIAILSKIPAARPPGLDLLLEIEGIESFEGAAGPDLAHLIKRQAEIAEAVEDLQDYNRQAKSIVRQCSQLSPTQPSQVPPGF